MRTGKKSEWATLKYISGMSICGGENVHVHTGAGEEVG